MAISTKSQESQSQQLVSLPHYHAPKLTCLLRLVLQKLAIEDARTAFSRLPHSNAVFRQCLEGKETLAEVLTTVEQRCQTFKRKKSTRFLEKLQKHTTWLQNISSVVDVAVQTQAGIGCPVWAPIKFVLKVSMSPLQRYRLNIISSRFAMIIQKPQSKFSISYRQS